MYPVISIGSLQIYSFNICIALGIIIGILYFYHSSKATISSCTQDDIVALLGADIPFIILGAFLHNKIVYATSFYNFLQLFPQNTGIAFLGGFIGGTLGFLLLYKTIIKDKLPINIIADFITPSIILGHAIGRIGCLLGGCCYGKPCFLGVSFQINTPAFQMYNGEKLFPTQLLEAILLIIIFLIIKKFPNHKFLTYLFSYSIIRFIIEFLRGDTRGKNSDFLSPAQIICIFIWLVLLFIWIKKSRHSH